MAVCVVKGKLVLTSDTRRVCLSIKCVCVCVLCACVCKLHQGVLSAWVLVLS